jgi:N-acetylglucosaminyldiphosphoundecaprenol N-acetyl-beta-D-mannosaminyltransferase
METLTKRVKICGIPVDALTMEQTLDLIDKAIQDKSPVHHVVVNAAKMVNAQKNAELKKSIVDCDIINADGKSIVWASRFLNCALPERVAGIDLMHNLVEMAAQKGYKIFLLGAEADVLQKVVDGYCSKYGDQLIAGFRNGYFKKDEESELAQQIATSKADMLFVAVTSPKKEIFLNTYKHILNVPFIMGVGGSFDVVAGKTKRAPIWMQHIGMEWFYRVLQEPKRMWKRYLFGNSEFIYLIAKEKIKQVFHSNN